MTDSVEVAVTADASGQLWSACVWDIRTGTQLMSYKGGGSCGHRSLSFVGTDYLVAGELSKPLIHVWPVNSSNSTTELRTVCSGLVTALAVSPDGKYLVAGIAEKLHVWQLESGKLLSVAARHFQTVTCVKFLEDGSHFVSGGEDGMVLVWSLSRLIACDSSSQDPVFTFADHYLPVKDLYVGHGGRKSRIYSVSLDGTCKVYDLFSGKMLISLVFDSNLTAITADVSETSLFVGTNSGDIVPLSLREPPRQLEHHLTEKDKENVFRGHSKAVTSLSASQDAITLLSGSADETVRLWHIATKQCIRTIQHKGIVTNAFITFLPVQIFEEKLNPSTVMHRLQRGTDTPANIELVCDMLITEDLEPSPPPPENDNAPPIVIQEVPAPINGVLEKKPLNSRERAREKGSFGLLKCAKNVRANAGVGVGDGVPASVGVDGGIDVGANAGVGVGPSTSALQEEVNDLRRTNAELFAYAANKILARVGVRQGKEKDRAPPLIDIRLALKDIDEKSIEPKPVAPKRKPKRVKPNPLAVANPFRGLTGLALRKAKLRMSKGAVQRHQRRERKEYMKFITSQEQ